MFYIFLLYWSLSKCKQIYLKHIPLWISAPLTDFLIFTLIKNVSFKKLGHFSCKIQMEVWQIYMIKLKKRALNFRI